MSDKGGGNYQAVLPAPRVNSEAVEYLFITVDKDKKVTRSQRYTLKEGQTRETGQWKDTGQVKEVRHDTLQESTGDCEQLCRQLRAIYGKNLPRFQTVDEADTLKVQTEINSGFYDKAIITEVADNAKIDGGVSLVNAGGHSTAFWVGAGVLGASAVGGAIAAFSGGGGGGGHHGGGSGNCTVEACGDGIDNDCDGQVDENCGGTATEICGDGIDNDGDGQADEGCGTATEICGDGIDNDGDGQVDENCGGTATEICDDGIDNDNDGQIDEGCSTAKEVCGDGIDNDGNGQIDEGCATGPDPLTPDTILGFWNFDGYRQDGVHRWGDIVLASDGTHTTNTYDADGQSTGSTLGTWTLSRSALTIYFSSGMPTWDGFASGDAQGFVFSTTSQGDYEFTR
jgi:hypothetical protein